MLAGPMGVAVGLLVLPWSNPVQSRGFKTTPVLVTQELNLQPDLSLNSRCVYLTAYL